MNLQSKNKIKVEAGNSMAYLMFLLLIFFVVISVMSNPGALMSLPESDAEIPAAESGNEPTVVITENNNYYLLPGETAENARGLEQIKDKMLQEVQRSGSARIKIAGHRKADYEAVFNLMTLAKSNGWEPVFAFRETKDTE